MRDSSRDPAVGMGLAVFLIAGGLLWLARSHRKVKERDQDWHRVHPEVPYEPPTS